MKFALRANVEDRDGDRSGQENRNVEQEHAQPARLRPAGRGMEKDAETGEEEIGEVRREVAGGLDLDRQGKRAAPDAGEQFFAGLDGAFRPAMLLRFKTIHVDGQFGRRHDIGQENELPARELRAVAEVEILGQGVMLPATRLGNARFTPEAGGAVKIEEAAAPAARDLLEEKVAVEKHRLHPGEERVAAIDVAPAGLDHPDLRVGEKMNGRFEQLGLRDKVGVEDANEIAAGTWRGRPRARPPCSRCDRSDAEAQHRSRARAGDARRMRSTPGSRRSNRRAPGFAEAPSGNRVR